MTPNRIEVMDSGIRIHDLEIPRKDVADYLRGIHQKEREIAFVQAVEVGTFCLERARTSQETEFVRRQVESLLAGVEKTVGAIPDAVQKELVSKIGSGDGQILAPVQALINEVSKTTTERLRDVRDLLSQEMDPARETSTLGKALRNLRDLLDPKRDDSIQGCFGTALRSVTAREGTLAQAVKAAVLEAVKPLVNEVDRLAKEIRGQEAAAEAIQQTIEKGASYEDEVVMELQEWSKVTGAEIHHVGTDNRPGDIVIKLPPSSLAATGTAVVVEVRDRQSAVGRKAISDALARAMVERKVDAAIYLSRSREGLAKEIGEWAEGECEYGPFVATTHEHLTAGVRFLIAQQRLAALRVVKPEFDVVGVEGQLARIRTALARVASINRKVTDIHGNANEIQREAETLRDEVRSALSGIEDIIRAISDESQPAKVA